MVIFNLPASNGFPKMLSMIAGEAVAVAVNQILCHKEAATGMDEKPPGREDLNLSKREKPMDIGRREKNSN